MSPPFYSPLTKLFTLEEAREIYNQIVRVQIHGSNLDNLLSYTSMNWCASLRYAKYYEWWAFRATLTPPTYLLLLLLMPQCFFFFSSNFFFFVRQIFLVGTSHLRFKLKVCLTVPLVLLIIVIRIYRPLGITNEKTVSPYSLHPDSLLFTFYILKTLTLYSLHP